MLTPFVRNQGFMAAANAMKRANAVKNLGVRAGGSKKTKCVRTVAFDSAVQAIRTAVAVKDRESIEVRESTRVVLGDIQNKGWCGVLLTLVS